MKCNRHSSKLAKRMEGNWLTSICISKQGLLTQYSEFGILGHKTPNLRRRRRWNFEKLRVLRKRLAVLEFQGKIRPNFDLCSNFGLFGSGIELDGANGQKGANLSLKWPIFRRRRRRKIGYSDPFLVSQAPKILRNYGDLAKNRPFLQKMKIFGLKIHNYA